MDTAKARPSRLGAALHFAGLFAFCVSQPLFDLLQRSPDFFIAHGIAGTAMIGLTLLLSWGSGVLFLAGATIAAWMGSSAYALTVRLGVGTISGLAFLLFFKQLSMPGPLTAGLAALLGVFLGVVYPYWKPWQWFLSVLSIGLLLFPVLFLSQPAISKLTFSSPGVDFAPLEGADPKTPVVLVVFDQLPLTSLLDANGNIDERRYPHFARLASQALWLPRTTTVSDRTGSALPAIVTGKYPQPDLQPTAADHPHSLFTLLGRKYRLQVEEPITRLHPANPRDSSSRLSRLASLASDLLIAYLHILLPTAWTQDLPPVTQSWKNFAATRAKSWKLRWIDARDQDRRIPLRAFIQSIRADDPQPTLYFLHSLLPHEPYQYLPSGKTYLTREGLPCLQARETWCRDPEAVQMGYARHLLQVGFADRLLGDLLHHLRQVGLYQDSLLVVTSDHGASFQASGRFKRPTVENFCEIMQVPLFIKLPRQNNGRRLERVTETIDILPTMAEALGLALPWPVDGRSALGEDPSPREKVRIFFGGARERLEFSPEQVANCTRTRWAGARQADTDPFSGPPARGSPSATALLGHPVTDFSVESSDRNRVRLDHPTLFREVDLDGEFLPCLISGRTLSGGVSPFPLVVAVNGTIQALTLISAGTPGVRRGSFSALVPESALVEGDNRIAVYHLTGSRADPVLRTAFVSSDESPQLGRNWALQAARWLWDVQTSGLHEQEWWGEHPVRWTNGRAHLRIPLHGTSPHYLSLELLGVGPSRETGDPGLPLALVPGLPKEVALSGLQQPFLREPKSSFQVRARARARGKWGKWECTFFLGLVSCAKMTSLGETEFRAGG